MIEFNDFIKEVNKKFQDELWADFESKFFGDDLFIKVGIDFSYGHQFELYIQNALMNKSIEEWTVDLKRNQIIYLKDREIDLLRKYPEDLQFPNEIRKPNPKKRQGIQTAHRCNARPFS